MNTPSDKDQSPGKENAGASVLPLAIILSILALGFLNPLATQAQGDWCGTDHYSEVKYQNDPRSKEMAEEFLKDIGNKAMQQAQSRSDHIDTIPVVIHVIHDDGIGNIDYQQIKDGIEVLNEDFNRLNSDTDDTRSLFDTLAADSEFHFRLAQKDPNGNCTDGVTRISSQLTYNADNSVKSLTDWPTDEYLNFWLVNDIEGGPSGGTILGYAQFPWQGIDNTYGIVMRHDRWGRTGTSSSEGRTATHEVGHCLGLLHTFQSGCGGDCANSGDNVCDTPPSDHNTFGCDKNQNTCSNDTQGPSPFNSDVVDQIENYMSYDDCQNMFSKGQKGIMKYVVQNISGLQNLVSTSNLRKTGVTEDTLCAVRFKATETLLCAGDSTQFIDESYHGVKTRSWIHHSANPYFTVKEARPYVTYNKPGTYDVELIVSNGNSTKTLRKEDLITVLDSVGEPSPYLEDMETEPVKKNRLYVKDHDNSVSWKVVHNAGYKSNSSIMLENYLNDPMKVDEFESGPIDLSSDSNIALAFDAAYIKEHDTDGDVLQVFASNNCGGTWSQRGEYTSNDLESGPKSDQYFIPNDDSEWKHFVIDAPLVAGTFAVSNFRFKFKWISHEGNNIYIDNINIGDAATLSLSPNGKEELDLRVFPNPASDHITIRTSINKEHKVRLMDITGRTVKEFSFDGERGKRVRTDISSIPSGVYLMEFRTEDQRKVERIVIQ